MSHLEGTFGVFIRTPQLIQFTNAVASVLKEEELCKDPAVFKGRGIEMDPHISVLMGLPHCRDVVRKIALETAPFTVKVQGYGVFRSRDVEFKDGTRHSYDVLWKSVSSNELHSLHQSISDATRIIPARDYKGHFTLAYTIPDIIEKNKELREAAGGDEVEIFVDKIVYKKYGENMEEEFKLEGTIVNG